MLPMFARRLLALLLMRPEPAEVLLCATAVGWAVNFANPAKFGPPGTTVAHVTNAVGPELAAGWAAMTAVLPLLSIAVGRAEARLASTFLCGFVWTAIVYFSWRQGTWMTGAVATSLLSLAALLWSQIVILRSWQRHEWQ